MKKVTNKKVIGSKFILAAFAVCMSIIAAGCDDGAHFDEDTGQLVEASEDVAMNALANGTSECVSALPSISDDWCQAVGCAAVYVDGGFCRIEKRTIKVINNCAKLPDAAHSSSTFADAGIKSTQKFECDEHLTNMLGETVAPGIAGALVSCEPVAWDQFTVTFAMVGNPPDCQCYCAFSFGGIKADDCPCKGHPTDCGPLIEKGYLKTEVAVVNGVCQVLTEEQRRLIYAPEMEAGPTYDWE